MTTLEHAGKSNHYAALRRIWVHRHKIPSWVDLEKIKRIYVLSKELSVSSGVRHVVDHIFPLKGVNVCGLHVLENLRIIPAFENSVKTNRILANAYEQKTSTGAANNDNTCYHSVG